MMALKKVLAIAITLSITGNVFAQEKKAEVVSYNPNATIDSSKKSIKSAAVGKIGSANITIHYHSPGVRKRVIWGGLVPYGEVWVTGAHSATMLEMDKPFMIGSKNIAAGTYAMFTIPGENDWTVILNTNWEQHLADDYNFKDDVVRIKVKPVQKETVRERLQYFIKDDGNSNGTIAIEWERLRIEFPVTITK